MKAIYDATSLYKAIKVYAPGDIDDNVEDGDVERGEPSTRHGKAAAQHDEAGTTDVTQRGEQHDAPPGTEEQNSVGGRRFVRHANTGVTVGMQSVGEARRERTRRERKRPEYLGMVGEQPQKRRRKRGPEEKRPRAGGVHAHGGELRHLIWIGRVVMDRIETDEDSRAKRRRR